ncbi:MAG: glutamate synthase-related protein, partial [Planctomycetota bacterium]
VPPRIFPVPKFSTIEGDGCLGCLKCVKRDSCVYDVYKKRKFDSMQIVDTADTLCISCMRCVQECKKNILSRARNPQFDMMGDDYWKPDLITSIWKQAETGSIPVSGSGYRGRFVGPGFDEMWTDMSEIVRPTRDGIHGREYISTVIELGRRPKRLEFDEDGKLLTKMHPFVEIPIPVVLDIPQCGFVTELTKKTIALAASKLGIFAVAPLDTMGMLSEYNDHLIAKFDPGNDNSKQMIDVAIAELAYSDDVAEAVAKLKDSNSDIITSVRIPLDEYAKERAAKLSADCGEILHFQASHKGQGEGARSEEFITKLIKEIHFELLKNSVRDQVTILISGGIAMAEHAAKIIACGADGVGIDTALLVALGCRLCPACGLQSDCPVEIDKVPVEWGTQRIINLIGSWHSQLIEVLGAMGLREVRRLRGELGRTLFFEDLERENFAPIFGNRLCSLPNPLNNCGQETLVVSDPTAQSPPSWYPPAKHLVAQCPSRFRNLLGKYKVVRTSACITCGKCAEICSYGVHQKAGNKMLTPISYLCRGPQACRAVERFCADCCPVNALRVGPDLLWETFGDARWTADLLASTWRQAETGLLPERDMEYKIGASGGGFDRITLAFPNKSPDTTLKPEEIDLSIPLNRRNDSRPEVTIGFPIYGGGMSFGSISLTTMLARARAFKAFDSFTCTGEGGYPEELKKYDDYVITQVATGLFGVREETIQRVRVVEFKYAQGAKPGLGGHLLGDKVTPAVAQMRESVEGSALFSPFPFHSVYSVEDHKKHVDWIKEINPKALVAVKVSTPTDVDMVAVGSYYAGAHIIHLDGSYGGTGAAPEIAKKNIAMPIEYAIPKVHRFLLAEGIRNEMTLVASGGLRTAWDVAKAIALGADAVVIGTSELVALECIRCGVCESGRGCPRGIATTDPELSATLDLDWATQRLINLFHSWSVQLQDILWRLGLRTVRELVGRTDLLAHLDYDNKLSTKDKVTLEMK